MLHLATASLLQNRRNVAALSIPDAVATISRIRRPDRGSRRIVVVIVAVLVMMVAVAVAVAAAAAAGAEGEVGG